MPKLKPSEVIAAIEKGGSQVLDLSDGGVDCFADTGSSTYTDLVKAIEGNKTINTINTSNNNCFAVESIGIIRLQGLLSVIAKRSVATTFVLKKCGIKDADIEALEKDPALNKKLTLDLSDNEDIGLFGLKSFCEKLPQCVVKIDERQFNVVNHHSTFLCRKAKEEGFFEIRFKKQQVAAQRADTQPSTTSHATDELSEKGNERRYSVFVAAGKPNPELDDLKKLLDGADLDLDFLPEPPTKTI